MKLLITLLLSPSLAFALSEGEARHLLLRTQFTDSASEVEALAPLDRAAAVDRVLASARKRPGTAPPEWTRSWTPPERPRGLSKSERKARRRARKALGMELKRWWLREMVETRAPFTEAMTLFWHGHFTSSLRTVKLPQLIYRQNALLREHALGRFDVLLKAIAKDPAMLRYLDGVKNKRKAPNENFAREVMELFTLGEGHYTEADIKAAARAFTGWGLDRRKGEFRFRRRQHDPGEKTLFGRTGAFDGDDVLDLLLKQPRTAEHIVERAWLYFVDDTPQPAEVKRIAAQFRQGWSIRGLMRELLLTEAFWASTQRLVRSPVELVVGTARRFELDIGDGEFVVKRLRALGQDLLDPPSVKGWPRGVQWITTTSLVAREALLRGLQRRKTLPVAVLEPTWQLK